MTKQKQRTYKSPPIRHWCGGRLVKDGHRALRCLRCGRIKFRPERPGPE